MTWMNIGVPPWLGKRAFISVLNFSKIFQADHHELRAERPNKTRAEVPHKTSRSASEVPFLAISLRKPSNVNPLITGPIMLDRSPSSLVMLGGEPPHLVD